MKHTGTFPGKSVTLASALQYVSGVSADGTDYSNPIPVGTTATFLNSDAQATPATPLVCWDFGPR